MDIERVKRYSCLVCNNAEISVQITEHTYEGDIPDVSNCDLSSYSNPTVSGGKLLANRPTASWEYIPLSISDGKKVLPIGGICEGCFSNKIVAALIKDGNVKFALERDLRR